MRLSNYLVSGAGKWIIVSYILQFSYSIFTLLFPSLSPFHSSFLPRPSIPSSLILRSVPRPPFLLLTFSLPPSLPLSLPPPPPSSLPSSLPPLPPSPPPSPPSLPPLPPSPPSLLPSLPSRLPPPCSSSQYSKVQLIPEVTWPN